ncbi:Bug family tripartite tricarboxylate transporter substrate binding protein [Variovorax sp. VNK109]|jgi:tripartite-type tricarboxylate transporter receptor subunit TctC|uniref:Bug family tripartite tricarboxylate transporter substrate binding protein n=1 Tax=Variovorax sp. VNK109 TaxID=3400919 RepID=UPI003C1209F8
MQRRNFNSAGAALLLSAIAQGVRAQATQPVRIQVGFAPGGGFDTIGRQLAPPLADALGRQVIVENRTGAAGRVALDYVRQAVPNGDVISITNQGAMTLFPYLYKNLPFDPVKDFTPITRLVSFDYVLAVGPGAPVNTFAEYLDWLKKNPEKGNYASPGNGTTPHLLGIWLHQKTNLPAVHVPYRGVAPAMPDLISGRLISAINTMGDLIEFHRAGKIKIIATMGSERSPFLPNVPTLKESGIDIVVPGWIALYGPAKMPADTLQKTHAAVTQAMQATSFKEGMLRLGWTASPSTPTEMGDQQRRELAAWGPVIKAAGIQPEE